MPVGLAMLGSLSRLQLRSFNKSRASMLALDSLKGAAMSPELREAAKAANRSFFAGLKSFRARQKRSARFI